MKNLKKYEDWRDRETETVERFKKQTTPMNSDEVIDYIINHCSEWLEYPVPIMRSLTTISNTPQIFHVNPVKRYSRDNWNFYTTIMDNVYS